jgi:hypothetical protein
MKRCVTIYSEFIIILLLFLIPGCLDLPSKLIAPNWDVNLNLPIANRTYSLADIIKQQKYISIQGTSSTDSIFLIQSDTYSQSVGVAQFVQVLKPTSSMNIPITILSSTSLTIYLPFPEGAALKSAAFVSGLFSMNITNPSLADISLSVTFPGIIKSDGTVFTINSNINALQPDTTQYDFAGCIYRLPANQSASKGDSLQVIINASSTLPLALLTANFYLSDFYFSSVTGNLPDKSLGIHSESYSLKIGSIENFRDKVFLQNSSLDININYKSALPNPFSFGVRNLNIIAMREDGSSRLLTDSTGSSNLQFNIENGNYHYTFTEKNSNIDSIIGFLPSTVVLNAEYIMNPDNNPGSATIQDSIQFSTDFSTKSIFAFRKSTITDSSSIGTISPDDSSRIVDTKNVLLNVNVQNGLPFSTWLTITFADQNYNRLFTVSNSTSGDSLYFSAASVDQNGEVMAPTNTTTAVQLDSSETQLLARAHYVIYSVTVETNGAESNPPHYVAIRPNDNIKIITYGSVTYDVIPDHLK